MRSCCSASANRATRITCRRRIRTGGARVAIEQALASAGLGATDIDYVNLHGTATPSNDAAESRAIGALFASTPCSSTKGATGHTLGAAGALEAVVAALALREQFVPAGVNTTLPDPALAADYVLASRDTRVRAVLSNCSASAARIAA